MAIETSGQQPVCGIIMPIATYQDYDAQHWVYVRAIIERAISKAGMRPVPVWEADETDIIQRRIVRNIYGNDIIICDVSGLNPNVMLELGLRLASKKPVIIVCDNQTKIPFDTNVIDHLFYDRNLQFQAIERFMDDLKARIDAVIGKSRIGEYTAFIDTFGSLPISKPESPKLDSFDFIFNAMEKISEDIANLNRKVDESRGRSRASSILAQYVDKPAVGIGAGILGSRAIGSGIESDEAQEMKLRALAERYLSENSISDKTRPTTAIDPSSFDGRSRKAE